MILIIIMLIIIIIEILGTNSNKTTIVFWVCIGIMQKKMETTIIYYHILWSLMPHWLAEAVRLCAEMCLVLRSSIRFAESMSSYF